MKPARTDKRPMSRRSFCLGFGAAILYVSAGAGAEKQGLDGTWGGTGNGVTAQVIIVGATVIGFYWRSDYLDAESPKFSEDGRTLSFAFRGGTAVLKRTGERTAKLAVSENGRVTDLNLRRD
jgi:hypothetical protein